MESSRGGNGREGEKGSELACLWQIEDRKAEVLG
jgi:hypothetical protein